jgi:hypothetical protein
MLSPGESFPHRSSGVSRRGFPHSLRPNHSPSVASVTSVRCFPLASRSRTETVSSPDTASLTASVPIIPLCGLRDLCAMLSPGESFSHQNSGVSRHCFTHSLRPNHFPLCGLRDLCASFPLASRFRTEAVASPDTASASSSMGMPRNFRAAFTNQKVEINSLVGLEDVIEKQSVPSTRRCLRGDPFGLSSSEFFV